MSSTFMGLEIARRGMFTQQTALYVTGQNVANASTPGYSRQRANFVQTEPYPGIGMNRPQIPGQMGTGVTSGSIQRIRESFLDTQYRGENNKLGYWQKRADSLNQMESIMNEPTDSGLANTMDQFWQSLQDLQVDPTNAGAKSVVRQRGQAVTDTFNYLSKSLQTVQLDQKNQIGVSVDQVNSILDQLNSVNTQIGKIEPNGYLPNDLYDERDRLIDQLSSYVNVSVSYVKSGGKSDIKAEGKVVIKLADDNGKPLVDNSGNEMDALLTDTQANHLQVNEDGPAIDSTNNSVKTITVGGTTVDFSDSFSTGSMKALIESYGYDDGGTATGTYINMLHQLDTLAYTFSINFNDVQKSGISANEIRGAQKVPQDIPPDYSFFADKNNADITASTNVKGFAGRIQLADEMNDSLDNIATATGSDPAKATLGDASNVALLSDVINNQYNYSSDAKTDFRGYYQNVIGSLGVDSQEATRLTQNTTSLQQSVDQKRQSVSAVSLDEEMTNMIQFQQAYNASARMITMQDELLDKVINGMGTGGR